MALHSTPPEPRSDRRTVVLTLILGAVLAVAGFGWGMRHARADAVADAPAEIVTEDTAGTGDDGGGADAVTGTEAPDTVTGLDPELSARFERAQADAASEGVPLSITSGWRSAREQQELIDDALTRYGSETEAHRWVLPAEVSGHVQRTAVDVGPAEGALWLGERQQEYGLCRTHANEAWHFELVGAVGADCPEPWPDASHGWS